MRSGTKRVKSKALNRITFLFVEFVFKFFCCNTDIISFCFQPFDKFFISSPYFMSCLEMKCYKVDISFIYIFYYLEGFGKYLIGYCSTIYNFNT